MSKTKKTVYIMGITAWEPGSAAVLVRNGRIIAAAQEERFTGKKNTSGFPKRAFRFCLEQAGIKAGDLQALVFSRSSGSSRKKLKTRLHLKTGISVQKIFFCSRLLAHAAGSFYPSGFKTAAFLVLDSDSSIPSGMGEAGTNLKILRTQDRAHSLSLLYSAFTRFLGFRINEGEFKVMGLAAYGKPVYANRIRQIVFLHADGSFELDLSYFRFHKKTGKPYTKKFIQLFKSDKINNKNFSADLAASIQETVQTILVRLAKTIQKETGEKNLCIAGIVGLNGLANSRIMKKTNFKDLYIQPASGPAGAALGSALFYYHETLKHKKRYVLTDLFLGKSWNNSRIRAFLKRKNIIFTRLSDIELIRETAWLLSKGKTVGWFQGRFEWGPRALGHRSILAHPGIKNMKDILNKQVKFREPFRPFAPSVPEKMVPRIFEQVRPGSLPGNFMLYIDKIKPAWRKIIPAVTHEDGTARFQRVKKTVDPLFYKLIMEFGKITGIPVLLNTSFNLKGHPIVSSPHEAWRTFKKSGLNVLVMGNYMITKPLLKKKKGVKGSPA